MSKSRQYFVNKVRTEKSKDGKEIPIYRLKTVYVPKKTDMKPIGDIIKRGVEPHL